MEAYSESVVRDRVVRKILNAYWISIGVYASGVLLNALFHLNNWNFLLWNIILLPTAKLSGLFLLLELIYRRHSVIAPYLCVLGGELAVIVVLIALYAEPEAASLVIVPVTLSIMFFKRRIVILASITAVLAFWIVYLLAYGPRHEMNLAAVIATQGVIVISIITLLYLLRRGREFLEELTISLDARQRLIAENVLMQRAVNTDPLTGIYNRVTFSEQLEEFIKIANKSTLALHLSVIDIDHFKQFNDSLGHQCGDIVLIGVARSLRNALGENCFVARYGGDEFVVMGLDMSADTFNAEMNGICEKIGNTSFTGIGSVTISAGIHTHRRGEDAQQTFARADQALYEAKNQGRNRVVSA